MTCLRGHDEPGPHGCRACRRIRQAAYERTDKGKATIKRYASSLKGRARRRAVFWRTYNRNRPAHLARFRAYYAANREHLLDRMKKRHAELKAKFGSVRLAFWGKQVENSR